MQKYFVAFLAMLLVVASVSGALIFDRAHSEAQTKATANVNVGIAFCGNTTREAKLLIERSKAYTNLFVLDSGTNPISRNQTAIEEICDYAVAQNLSVIVNLGHIYSQSWFWRLASPESIRQRWTDRWGDKFLGIYYNDEPGGIQLDGDWTGWFERYSMYLNRVEHQSTTLYGIYSKMEEAKETGIPPDNYDLEAKFFVEETVRDDRGFSTLKNAGFRTFTSDYGLYWFDYLGGYDTMFAEIGWNCSVSQQIGLVRGAARLQDKDWGVIITWKYGAAPYLDSGEQMYEQMLSAYQGGAKYIVIFNYPIMQGNEYGALNDEHFIALQRFWKDITNAEKAKALTDLSKPEAILVLPRNYGWGMRRPDDVIWGFWGPDDKTIQIGTVMSRLLAQYGPSLDIAYDDSAYPVTRIGYSKIFFWNGTNR